MTRVTISRAREIVLSEGRIPDELASIVRPEVLLSWRRSLLSGAQVTLPELPFVGESNAQSQLCVAADPVLSKLAERLSGLGAGVLLANRHAQIVRRWVSDTNILPMLDMLRSDAGFTGSEEIVGTNGIGTVAETGRPIQIVGHEHLMASMTVFACIGVPVFHPITRRLEGIITMSCGANSGSALLAPLMMSAAADVEHRMLEQSSCRERIVLDAYLEASRRGSRCVAGVGRDIFIAGPRVMSLLGGIQQVTLWDTVRSALGSRSSVQSEIILQEEQVLPINCKPIMSQDTIIGALVEFFNPRSAKPSRPSSSTGPRAKYSSVGIPGMVGASGAWRETLASVREAVAGSGPILVAGEVSVGKFTLLLGALAEHDPDVSVHVVEIASPSWTDVTSALTEFEKLLQQEPACVLLRHVEAMSAPVAIALATRLNLYDGNARITGTLTSDNGATCAPEHDRLVAAMGGIAVQISPLRERSEDIPIIANMLLADGLGRRRTVSSGALRAMVRAPWPGNVMQIRSMLDSIAPHAGGEIKETQLPPEIQACATRRRLTTLERVELRVILDALKQARGNKVLAARIVGVSRSTLYRKLNSYRIDPDTDYF